MCKHSIYLWFIRDYSMAGILSWPMSIQEQNYPFYSMIHVIIFSSVYWVLVYFCVHLYFLLLSLFSLFGSWIYVHSVLNNLKIIFFNHNRFTIHHALFKFLCSHNYAKQNTSYTSPFLAISADDFTCLIAVFPWLYWKWIPPNLTCSTT